MDDSEGLHTGGRRRSSPSPASPVENVDILSEILLRLPPAPSSLPRASGVCKLWRRLVSDPAFLRRFQAHHRRNPPLLGFFSQGPGGISFTPTLEPPDRIPPGYFSLQLDDARQLVILCCRHGLVLFYMTQLELLVWDSVTGDQHHVVVPRACRFSKKDLLILNGAVLRAAGDVIGGGPSSNFKVVLVGTDLGFTRTYARVYSSDTGIWGHLISTASPSIYPMNVPSVMVGASLYWLLGNNSPGIRVLEFDLDRQCLAVIETPLKVSNIRYKSEFRVMQAEGGVLGFLFLSSFSIQLWKRKTDCHGVAGWELGRTIDLHTLLPLGSDEGLSPTVGICGFAEDDNVLLLRTRAGAFMIQLESMQSKKPFGMHCSRDKTNIGICDKLYHPFTCVYTAGIRVGGKQDGAELLQNA